MNKDELQDIKNRGYRRRAISPNDWATILKDVEELIAAVEELQAENKRLTIQLDEAQDEILERQKAWNVTNKMLADTINKFRERLV